MTLTSPHDTLLLKLANGLMNVSCTSGRLVMPKTCLSSRLSYIVHLVVSETIGRVSMRGQLAFSSE